MSPSFTDVCMVGAGHKLTFYMYSMTILFSGFPVTHLGRDCSFLSSGAESIVPVFLLPKLLATTAKRTATFIKKRTFRHRQGYRR